VEEVWALLEAGAHAEVLRRVPEGTVGELAYLRGRALLALSRYAEADAALALAHHPEAENLRVLCWAKEEDYPRALPRLEELSSRGGRFKLALGKVYLGLGRLSEALRQLYECGLPEAEVYPKPPSSALKNGCSACAVRATGARPAAGWSSWRISRRNC
jgi:tetratricopeptide (TPR) repeat protein